MDHPRGVVLLAWTWLYFTGCEKLLDNAASYIAAVANLRFLYGVVCLSSFT